MRVRVEEPGDRQQVYVLNAAVFPAAAEANLVEALRGSGELSISLVAEERGSIVGHIAFSPVNLSERPGLRIAGLGPMAVAEQWQRRGIGKALAGAGLDACREAGFGACVVLGHPEYYPKFGFVPSTRFGFRWEHDAPEEAFMAVELRDGYLSDAAGVIRYARAFDGV